MRKLYILFVALLACIGIAYADVCEFQAGASVTASTTLNASCVYDLSAQSPALSIDADNVVFDCSGSELLCENSNVCIQINGYSNITIQNCFISRSYQGIVLNGASDNILITNNIINSDDNCINLNSGSGDNYVVSYNNLTSSLLVNEGVIQSVSSPKTNMNINHNYFNYNNSAIKSTLVFSQVQGLDVLYNQFTTATLLSQILLQNMFSGDDILDDVNISYNLFDKIILSSFTNVGYNNIRNLDVGFNNNTPSSLIFLSFAEGINLSNANIHDNIIYGQDVSFFGSACGTCSVLNIMPSGSLGSPDFRVNDISVHDNNVIGTGLISVYTTANSAIANIAITDNQVNAGYASSIIDLPFAVSASGISISGNNFIAPKTYGIVLTNAQSSSIAGNTIVSENGTLIQINGTTTGLAVSGNTLNVTAGTNIKFDALVSGSSASGNTIRNQNCTQGSYVLNAGSGNTVTDACTNFNLVPRPTFTSAQTGDVYDYGLFKDAGILFAWNTASGVGVQYRFNGLTDVVQAGTSFAQPYNFTGLLPLVYYPISVQAFSATEESMVYTIYVSFTDTYSSPSQNITEDVVINTTVNTTETPILENSGAGITVDMSSAIGSGTVATAGYISLPVSVQVPDIMVKTTDVYVSQGITGTITITQSYDEPSLPTSVDESQLRLYAWYSSQWNLGENQVLDTTANTISADFDAVNLKGTPLMFGYFGATTYVADDLPKIGVDILGSAGVSVKTYVPMIVLGAVLAGLAGVYMLIRMRLR